eukprot:TRINITY_DN5699_c0_g1_i1.p1 TRINITY_DN5699_c0_g1~~TRINITY_DN5699_c0_g1_i1.p1  ORF type:complete len:146 (-),score=13.61 TRINITY_DN5699_c0_g1_i1:93-530(-)
MDSSPSCMRERTTCHCKVFDNMWMVSFYAKLEYPNTFGCSYPFVRMSLNLDRHFHKALYFKYGSVSENSVISSLPQELVTSIIQILLGDTDQEVKNNLAEDEHVDLPVVPRIKEQFLPLETYDHDNTDYVYNIELKWFSSVPVEL